MGARHGPLARPWQSVSMPSTPGVCGKFYGFRTPGTLQMTQEHHGLLASLRKGQVVPVEVFRAPGSISSRGGPPPCHRRCAATTTWLAEASWSTKIHLAESDKRRRSAPELWGPHGLEEGKGKGYLASSRLYAPKLSARSSPPRRRREKTVYACMPKISEFWAAQTLVDYGPPKRPMRTWLKLVDSGQIPATFFSILFRAVQIKIPPITTRFPRNCRDIIQCYLKGKRDGIYKIYLRRSSGLKGQRKKVYCECTRKHDRPGTTVSDSWNHLPPHHLTFLINIVY